MLPLTIAIPLAAFFVLTQPGLSDLPPCNAPGVPGLPGFDGDPGAQPAH